VFDWDEANAEKIFADHRVTQEEAEEALSDPDRLRIDAYNVRGERRSAVLGATEADRVLHIVYTRRSERIRVITAYDATAAERRKYWRSR